MIDGIISHIIIHTIFASSEMKNAECILTQKKLIPTKAAELHSYYSFFITMGLGQWNRRLNRTSVNISERN